MKVDLYGEILLRPGQFHPFSICLLFAETVFGFICSLRLERYLRAFVAYD